MTSIAALDAWTVRLPLRHPVGFGAVQFTDRDYCVVRLTDADGLIGVAYSLARGAPLTAAVSALAPRVLGADPMQTERLWWDVYEAMVTQGQRATPMRALSLIDIAMWDLKARRCELPLSLLLGGHRDRVPVSIGGAYFREARTREEIAAELAGYLSRGFTHVKAPAGGLSPDAEEDWVAFLRGCLGKVELAIDAHWSWRDGLAAKRVMERLDQFSLSWVEDPLPAEAVDAVAELRTRIRTPIAVGDEQSGRWFYQQLHAARAADIWRVDVTTVGGFTEFRRVAALASIAVCPISTHIYPELHIHCAASDPVVMGVEYVDPEADIDLSYKFIDVPAQPKAGMLDVPAAHGLGITLNWDLINSQAADEVSLAK